jgi:hypothetical protein
LFFEDQFFGFPATHHKATHACEKVLFVFRLFQGLPEASEFFLSDGPCRLGTLQYPTKGSLEKGLVEGHQSSFNPDIAQPCLLKESRHLPSYPSLYHLVARCVNHLASQSTVGNIDGDQIHVAIGDNNPRPWPYNPHHFGQCPFRFTQVPEDA